MANVTRKSILGGAAGGLGMAIASAAVAQTPKTATGAQPGAPASSSPVYKAVPQLGRLRDDVLFGDVWKQPEMSLRDRSIVTCAVLAALGRDAELAVHVRRAIDNGVTRDELRGMAVQVAFYAGFPAGIAVGRAALEFLQDGR